MLLYCVRLERVNTFIEDEGLCCSSSCALYVRQSRANTSVSIMVLYVDTSKWMWLKSTPRVAVVCIEVANKERKTPRKGLKVVVTRVAWRRWRQANLVAPPVKQGQASEKIVLSCPRLFLLVWLSFLVVLVKLIDDNNRKELDFKHKVSHNKYSRYARILSRESIMSSAVFSPQVPNYKTSFSLFYLVLP